MFNRLDDIEILLKNSVIGPDAYQAWRQNPVTQRFMLEVEQDLLITQADTSPALRDTVEKIALACVKNAEHCEVLEEVLEWKPHELESND